MTCVLAIVALAGFLQWVSLGETTTENDYAAPSSTPALAEGPGETTPPSPGPDLWYGESTPPRPEPLAAEEQGMDAGFPALALPRGQALPKENAPTTPSSVEAATARVNAEGGVLTEEEAIAVLRAAQWPEELIPQALAVSWCESRRSPYATNGGNEGLFQINVTEGATIRGSWFTYFGVPDTPESWYNPVVNATVARWIFEMSGWAPWSCRP